MRLQIAQLDTHKVARRAAELNAILEAASAKIDRFGWGQMDQHVKDQLCADWCDVLEQYTLDEVRAGVRAVFRRAGGKIRSINEHEVEKEIVAAHKATVEALPRRQAQEPPANRGTQEQRDKIADIVRRRFPSNRNGE